MTVEKRLKNIITSFFYSEPLLFSVVCTHSLVENSKMNVCMRSGKMRIEFSPALLEEKSDLQLESYLRVELNRILLKHPYERQPFNCQKKILLLASDLTLYQFYKPVSGVELNGVEYLKSLSNRFHTLINPLGEKWAGSEEEKFFMRNTNINRETGELELIDKLSFEQWYKRIEFLISQISVEGEDAGIHKGSENFGQTAETESELWEENEQAQQLINNEIQKCEIDEGWGGTGGEEKRLLLDEVDFSFDYRRALAKFRQNIVAANRTLTRMRPSRRYGFKAMGSRYERKANILIAVDVSGSITDESFEHFTHAIKNFFFLGIIEKIDLIFFDVNLKNTKPVSFRKKVELKEITGRGGTSFKAPVDFFTEHKSEYSGMIIFTDGEGEMPEIKNPAVAANILWILDSRLSYEKSRQWIDVAGCKSTYLPF